jgi:hypothetical protein
MLLKFFCDFKLVEAGEMPRSAIPSPFLYGREPAKEDLDQHIDIARADTVPLLTFVEAFVAGRSVSANEPRLLTIFDQAGTGKTTILKRAAHELARRGIPVFVVHTLSRIEVRNTIDCLRTASVRLVLVVDGLADHAEQIREILQDGQLLDKIVVLAAERSYRRQHIELMFNETPWKLIEPKPLDKSELRQLIELYRSYGLVGNADAIRSPSTYASHLRGDPIAVAVCRILNDFKPLQNIVESLWNATDSRFRMPYLCAAIAKHCHVSGIRYATLQSIAGSKNSLSDLLARDVPLGLAENNENDDYVVPLNASVSETILQWRVEIDGDSILEAFRNISSRIAFYVNRLAIITRTPEARLAGRLFDADKVVKPLLRNKAAQLYETCQKDWEWNSRFWEQRALLIADSDLETALRYARHAVAIEHHPYPLTTLGKLLLRRMEVNFSKGSSAFDEAFGILGEAINIEGARSRVTVHPYTNLFSGSIRFIEMGGEPNSKQREMLLKHIANARYWFPNDPTVQVELVRLSEMLR